jgi:hypothetical protein
MKRALCLLIVLSALAPLRAEDLRMTGLPAEPKIRQDGDLTTIEAAGLTAKLKGAKVEKGDQSIKILLP